MKRLKKDQDDQKHVNQSMFLNKDGYKNGGVEITPPNVYETQTYEIQGQKGMLKEKKRKFKLF